MNRCSVVVAVVALVAVASVALVAGAPPSADARYKHRPAGGPPSYANKYKKKTGEELPATKEEAMEFAETFMATNKFWKAIKIYKQILVSFPEVASTPEDAMTVYNHLAISYAQDKPPNPTETIKYFGLTLAEQKKLFADKQSDLDAIAGGTADTKLSNPTNVKRLRDAAANIAKQIGQTYYNLGYAHETTTRTYSDALDAYKQALEWDNKQVRAYVKAAFMSSMKGDHESVIRYLVEAIKLNPSDHALLGYLGDTYNNMKQFSLAIVAYLRAIALNPHEAKLHMHAADTYSNIGSYVRALRHYEIARRLAPADATGLVGWWAAKQELADWSGVGRDHSWSVLMANLTELVDDVTIRGISREQSRSAATGPNGEPEAPIASLLSPYQSLFLPLSAEQQMAVAVSWAKETVRTARSTAKYDKPYHELYGKPKPKAADGKRKIRLGYLSRRFEDYPGTQLMLRVFGLHDRSQFEVYAYANGPDDGSSERATVRETSDVFRGAIGRNPGTTTDLPLHARTPPDVARLIASDGIDILIDYDGAHNFNSLAVLALRPAPVQIGFLGFAGTTGAEGVVDYLISDTFITPGNMSQYFSEELLHLPGTYQPQDHQQLIADPNESTPPLTRESLGLPTDPESFVFASFNRVDKLEPTMFGAWLQILKRVPNSVLWLYVGGDEPINGKQFLEHQKAGGGGAGGADDADSPDAVTPRDGVTPTAAGKKALLAAATAAAKRELAEAIAEQTESAAANSGSTATTPSRLAANKRQSRDMILRNLCAFAAQPEFGISCERLVFAHRLPKPQHLARHRFADLFLDTRYYGAHTTGSDALYTGLPVLTLPGDTFASRVGGSLVTAANAPELIAYSLSHYIEKAVNWASTFAGRTELNAIRQRLVSGRKDGAYSLFDTPRFVKVLETAYSAVWKKHTKVQRSAAPIDATASDDDVAELIDNIELAESHTQSQSQSQSQSHDEL